MKVLNSARVFSAIVDADYSKKNPSILHDKRLIDEF
jgi:hypothetical protein